MKKTLLLTILTVFTIGAMAVTPVMIPHQRSTMLLKTREALGTFTFFKAVKDSREQLNLTAKQNVKLDKILNEVRTFTENLRKQKQDTGFIDSFAQDNFDPFKVEEKRKAKREEVRKFYLSKIKEIHDLLNKKQREKLVSILKTKRQRLQKIQEMRDKRPWNKDIRIKKP